MSPWIETAITLAVTAPIVLLCLLVSLDQWRY